MITVIYSTHKDAQYNAKFKEHLSKTIGIKEFEILEYINNNEYSLAQVYNKGIAAAKNNIIVCCHNDIKLENGWGKRLLADFEANPDFGIIGKAGSCYFPESGVYWERMQQTMVGQVYHHPPGQNKWLNKYSPKLPFLIPVVTIDGLFMAFDKTKIKFTYDEAVGKFHFYDHGFCLYNYLSGVKIGVTSSFEITHESVGQPNSEFYETKDEFLKKWKHVLPLDLKPNSTYVNIAKEKPIKNAGKVAILLSIGEITKEVLQNIESIYEYTDINLFELFILYGNKDMDKVNLDKYSNANFVLCEGLYNTTRYNEVITKLDKTFEYVLLMSDNIRFNSNIIHGFIKTFKSKANIGSLSCRIHYSDNLVSYNGIGVDRENGIVFKNKESYYNYDINLVNTVANIDKLVMFKKDILLKHLPLNDTDIFCSEYIGLTAELAKKRFSNMLDGSLAAHEMIDNDITVKIISGYSDKGGSTTAFINLTNYFNANGIKCVFYGPHKYHLDKCKSALLRDLKFEKNDIVISHFIQLAKRPDVKKIVLSSHEKWWFDVASIPKFWDEVIFLHDKHREYHNKYTGHYSIIPNLKESLVATNKPDKEMIAGIIGTIEPRKQTHISIQRALSDGCSQVLLFGHVGDQKYFDEHIEKYKNNPKIKLIGHTTNKQEMYDSIGRVYHSSKGEVACLVKDECFLTKTKFFGNEETEHEISTLNNEEILQLWKTTLMI